MAVEVPVYGTGWAILHPLFYSHRLTYSASVATPSDCGPWKGLGPLPVVWCQHTFCFVCFIPSCLHPFVPSFYQHFLHFTDTSGILLICAFHCNSMPFTEAWLNLRRSPATDTFLPLTCVRLYLVFLWCGPRGALRSDTCGGLGTRCPSLGCWQWTGCTVPFDWMLAVGWAHGALHFDACSGLGTRCPSLRCLRRQIIIINIYVYPDE